MVLPVALHAQGINRSDLFNRNWRIVGMKCSDAGMYGGDEDKFIHYYASFVLTPTNPNNTNYGTYTKRQRDQSDNPIERGMYAINWDENRGTSLTFTPRHGKSVSYIVEMVSPHHLTLIQQGEDVKCNTVYAIAP